jgi:hypothetical protein
MYPGGATTIFSNTYLPITQVLPITITPMGTTSTITVPVPNKALHELFTTDYGRMNSLLGVEVPLTNWVNQTTIPFTNQDPTTDFIPDGQPQVWRITHNGVDTHTIHFHLLNAQLINRVGWDGQVRPPDANELGWKESVRMNPLEDVFVALAPIHQNLPWPLMDKWRPIDVDRALGTSAQFTGVDVHNNPVSITNSVVNFGQEYVWHCHLLGHEEEDMLRAEVFVVAPETPNPLAAVRGAGNNVNLAWTDNSASAMSFAVERATDAAFTAGLVTTVIPAPLMIRTSTAATQVSFVDNQATRNTQYYYRVQASKSLSSPAFVGTDQGSAANPYVATSGWSNIAIYPPPAPQAVINGARLNFGKVAVGTVSAPQTVTLSNPGTAPLLVSGVTVIGANPADFAVANNCGASLPAPTVPVSSCTISVTFAASAPLGTRSARLSISQNASAPLTVTLAGEAVAPPTPFLIVDQTALTFGTVLNQTPARQRVTATNIGLAAATLGVPSLSGTLFTQTTTCGPTLAAGASCAVNITFGPTSTAATANEVLTIGALAPALAQTVALTGTVQPLLLSSNTLAFGTVNRGVNSDKVVTLTNSGSATMTFPATGAFAVTGSGYSLLLSTCGTSLAASGSCAVTVRFNPPSTGVKTGTLSVQISSATPATTATVALTGTGK